MPTIRVYNLGKEMRTGLSLKAVGRSGRLLVRASGTLVRKVVQFAVASSPNVPTLRATSARQEAEEKEAGIARGWWRA
jgi:hypothetical protein